MVRRISEEIKPVMMVAPVSTSDVTSDYMEWGDYREALLHVSIRRSDGITPTNDVAIQLREADVLAGTGAATVGDAVEIKNPADTVVGATVVEVDVDSTQAIGNKLKVNGVEFERTGDGFDADDRPHEYETRAELIEALEHEFPHLDFDLSTNTLTIECDSPGSDTITVEIVETNETELNNLKMIEAQAYIDITKDSFDKPCFSVQVDPDQESIVSVVAILGKGYYKPADQSVAVYKVL